MDDSKVMCMLPWTHMHIWPNGNVLPCCAADSSQSFGNTNHSTLAEIWNNEHYRELRTRMLSGVPSDICKRCYQLESHGVNTQRLTCNRHFSHLRHLVDQTTLDGTSPGLHMAHLDIRWSNICNLRCRSCGPELSSGWYDEHKAMDPLWSHPRISTANHDGQLWAQLEPHLAEVEQVDFAGGESLITDEHYRILDHWLSLGKTDVRISYTTNFTVMDYKKRDIYELWRRFENVRVCASLDASHARGEYLRKNMVWADVVQNRQRMLREVPHVYFEITPTISLYNALHIADFHREWVEQGLLELDNIRINLLTVPTRMSVQTLPSSIKHRVRDRLAQHSDWLRQNGAAEHTLRRFQGIATLMDSEDRSDLIPQFLEHNSRIDGLRNEQLFKTFPELLSLDPSQGPSFCALPWTNINTTPQGRVKLCCNISDQHHVRVADRSADWSRHSLQEIWNGAHMQEVRQSMLQGKTVSDCEICYRQERLGNTSPRQSANAAAKIKSDLSTTASLPTSFELRTSTRCNLQCMTCWSGSSKLIAQQRQLSLGWDQLAESDAWHLRLPQWLRDSWQQELDHVQAVPGDYVSSSTSLANFRELAPGLERLYITGGEPTMDASIPRYLDALLDAGNHSCHVSFTTNCTLWNAKLMRRLARFAHTEVQLSVDGHGTANEFIRHGSHWHEVTENVRRYLQEPSIQTIKIYTVISAFNCLELEPLLSWIINTVNLQGRKVTWFPIILDSPHHQRVSVLPLEARLAAADRLTKVFTEQQWPEHTCCYRDGLAHCLRALRDPETTASAEGRHKLRERLFYDWHQRRRLDAIKPADYWNSVLPNLAAALDWNEQQWREQQ